MTQEQNENLKKEMLHILSQLTEYERKELWEELVQDGLIPASLAYLSPEL